MTVSSELHPLLPTIIAQNTPQHKAVEALTKALENDAIHNIAITGTYGSGKSSVIETYIKENKSAKHVETNVKGELKWCRISLATIEALSDFDNNEGKEDGKEKEAKESNDKEEALRYNKRIEYSLLQQLLYKEDHKVLPKSRFKKIPFLSKSNAIKLTVWIVSCIFCWLILFEPRAFHIDSLYDFFAVIFGKGNLVCDIIAAAWLIFSTGYSVYQIVRRYSGLTINKISVPNADIKIDGDKSIFNDYLEEIIYFFQETKYNVVFIEDLDRFGSTHLFLKLRELNNLINHSHMLDGNSIRFVYAIRDDMFTDSGRTKFFDVIIPVIPIINPYNAATKLKEELQSYGLKGVVPDEDLKDMVFYIKEMRLVKNIANEFYSYYTMLDANNYHLNTTKLMGMIIYKNLFPRDFGRLPYHEGKLFTLLSNTAREKLISLVKDKVIKSKRDYWNNVKAAKQETTVNNANELRTLYLLRVYQKANLSSIARIIINGTHYEFNRIAQDETLFNHIINNSVIYYDNETNWSNSGNKTYDFKTIENEIDKNHSYKERLSSIQPTYNKIDLELHLLDEEEQRLNTYTVKDVLNKYPELCNEDYYKKLEIPRMIEIFVKHAYLDDDYYDYISYFYDGITSDHDHDIMMSLKSSHEVPFNQQTDNIKGFIKDLPEKLLSTDLCLINSLYDYIFDNVKQYNKEQELLLAHLNESNKAIRFLQQYLVNGKHADEVFDSYVNHDKEGSWKEFSSLGEDSISMIREWFKVADLKNSRVEDADDWLKQHYTFVRENIDYYGQDRVYEIIDGIYFRQLDDVDSPLLDYICANEQFIYTANNLTILANRYNKKQTVTEDSINISRILNGENETFKEQVKRDINDVIQYMSPTAKDDDEPSLLFIINNEDLTDDEKRKYLHGQVNKIESLEDIKMTEHKQMAMVENIVSPTWRNVLAYLQTVNDRSDNQTLATFITKNIDALKEYKSGTLASTNSLLFDTVVNSGLISDDSVYRNIINAFAESKFDADISQTLSEKHLNMLIDNGFIPYKGDHRLQLKERKDSSYAHYLEYYWKEFEPEVESDELTVGAILYLLNSTALTALDKEALMKAIPLQMPANNSEIATAMSDCLSIRYTFIDYPTMYSIIQNSISDEGRMSVAISTIHHCLDNDKNEDVIKNIIQSLGGHYLELLDDSKRPTFENAAGNLTLFNLLKQGNIISSIKPEGHNSIRIYPKLSK